MRIGIISDTHGWLHPRVAHYFEGCDEIWHAGDIGDLSVLRELETIAPVRAVYGNIDNSTIRAENPSLLSFPADGLSVFMTHIGGVPGRYSPAMLQAIRTNKPGLVVAGHSHITMVKFDKTHDCLYINPGSAGYHGFHKIMTLIRLTITKGSVSDLEVIELGARAKVNINS